MANLSSTKKDLLVVAVIKPEHLESEPFREVEEMLLHMIHGYDIQ